MLRSNYFAVKDERVFFEFCDRRGFEAIQNSENLHGFLGSAPFFQEEDDAFLEEVMDEEQNADEGQDALLDAIADLIASDNVAIVMEINHDKMRWLDGTAWAVNSRHEIRKVDLRDIYKLAEQLGPFVTEALY